MKHIVIDRHDRERMLIREAKRAEDAHEPELANILREAAQRIIDVNTSASAKR